MTFILKRIFTPQLGILHIHGDGLWCRHPGLAYLAGVEPSGSGKQPQLRVTETEVGRRLLERNQSLVQRPLRLEIWYRPHYSEDTSSGERFPRPEERLPKRPVEERTSTRVNGQPVS